MMMIVMMMMMMTIMMMMLMMTNDYDDDTADDKYDGGSTQFLHIICREKETTCLFLSIRILDQKGHFLEINIHYNDEDDAHEDLDDLAQLYSDVKVL